MNDERVEAAAKELHRIAMGPKADWSKELPQVKVEFVKDATTTLAAADAASGEKVVYTATESTLFAKVFQGAPAGSSFFLQPGEELVVRKARTNG